MKDSHVREWKVTEMDASMRHVALVSKLTNEIARMCFGTYTPHFPILHPNVGAWCGCSKHCAPERTSWLGWLPPKEPFDGRRPIGEVQFSEKKSQYFLKRPGLFAMAKYCTVVVNVRHKDIISHFLSHLLFFRLMFTKGRKQPTNQPTNQSIKNKKR